MNIDDDGKIQLPIANKDTCRGSYLDDKFSLGHTVVRGIFQQNCSFLIIAGKTK